MPHPIEDRFKPGDPFPTKAEWWNRLLDALRYCVNFQVDASNGLEFQTTATGGTLRIDPTRLGVLKLGRVTGSAITARSTTTLGSGSVVIQHLPKTVLTPGHTVTAYNFSDSTIAVDSYVSLGLIDGKWVILSVDCP